MKYEIEIIETLKKTVVVNAENLNTAMETVENDWYSGKHILSADDFTGVEFSKKK